MSETLLIRLGSQASDMIHWLVWSNSENNIIASGELANAEQLSQLSEKSTNREVVTLVSSSDINLKSLHVPAKSQRAVMQAVPYLH